MSVEAYNNSLNVYLHSVCEDINGDYKIGTKSGQLSNLRQNLTPTFLKKVLDRVVLWWYYGRAPQKRGVTDIEN